MEEKPLQFSMRGLMLVTALVAVVIAFFKVADEDAISLALLFGFIAIAAGALFVIVIDNKWSTTVLMICTGLIGLAVLFGACAPVIR